MVADQLLKQRIVFSDGDNHNHWQAIRDGAMESRGSDLVPHPQLETELTHNSGHGGLHFLYGWEGFVCACFCGRDGNYDENRNSHYNHAGDRGSEGNSDCGSGDARDDDKRIRAATGETGSGYEA